MNSSLQCLVHSMPLMHTFLTGAYRADLNRDNPLGLGGKLAAAFGGLMGKIWQGGVGHVSPKHFKWQLGKFAPQFGGYAQQDSQELLAFLLDGLHEDLNRIAVKPYFEEKDDDSRPDAEVAAEAWDNYRARNDSVIVDHFQGLYKSSLRCPACGRTSVKFDPFMYLSLPLPTPKTRTLTIIIVDAAGAVAPMQVSVEVLKRGTIGDVLQKVAACCVAEEEEEGDKTMAENEDEAVAVEGAQQDQWLLAQWNASTGVERLHLFRDPNLPVSSIKEPVKSTFLFSNTKPTLLVAYRFPPSSSSSSSSSRSQQQPGPESGFRPIVVFHKAKNTLAGVPTVLYLPTTATAPLQDTSATAPTTAAEEAAEGEVAKQLAELTISKQAMFSNRWVVTSTSSNLIEDALVSFMRPFVKEGVDANAIVNGADSTAAAAGVDGGEKEDVGMTEAVNETATTASDAASLPDLDPLFAVDTAAGDGNGRDNTATDAGATTADTKTATDGVDNMAVDGESQLATITATPAPAPPALPASTPPNGVSLVLAKPNGDARTAIALTPTLGDSSTTDPLYVLIEWNDDIVAEYLDLTPWTTPKLHASTVAAATAATAPLPSVTLNDCVDTFLQPEKLDASDSWYCTGCKSHVQAEKKLDLWRLPEVLVVHLKRFSYSRYSRDKLDTEVDFPLQGLDLRNVVPVGEGGTRVMENTTNNTSTAATAEAGAASETMAVEDSDKKSPFTAADDKTPPPAPVYDLYAVSNHYGGLGGGHYTAYCQMPDDGKWYTFDDSSVTEVNNSSVKSSAAYVLFYRRRGAEAQDGDIEKVIESARENGIGDDGAGGSLPDVDLFTGGFHGSGSGGLTPRKSFGLVPALEQVTEEADEDTNLGFVIGGGPAAAALVLDKDSENDADDDGDDVPPPLMDNTGDDEGMEEGVGSPQHQPSLAAHALPLDDLDDDVNMDDI
jgi:ubiquitin carboxyl-terminal hydrolase 4/11/15